MARALLPAKSNQDSRPRIRDLLCFDRFHHHELAHLSLVQELDASRDLGKEGIVFAAAHVEAGLYPRAALANNDRSPGNDLSAECLETKPLRVGIAPVS